MNSKYWDVIDKKVYTQSGFYLGKINNIIINTNEQFLVSYEIAPNGLIKKILKEKFLVNRDQVVSFDNNSMIVEDGIEKEVKKVLNEEDFIMNPAQDIGGQAVKKE